jgi:hypothetical protein
MTTATETKSKITEATRSLADRLKAEITVDAKTGTTPTPKTFFKDNLPEGLTMDHVSLYEGYRDTLIKAGGLALGELATPVMAENPELERATLTIPTSDNGKNYIGYAFDRERQVPNRNEDGTTGTKTKYGSLTVDVVTYGTKNRGELANVKSELSEMAMAAFGKK